MILQSNKRHWRITRLCSARSTFSRSECLTRIVHERCVSHTLLKLLVAPPQSSAQYVRSLAETYIERENDREALLQNQLSSAQLTQTQYTAVLLALR